ncbi:MAG: hypothetical protein CMM25_01825 [Rhodospirillaceae bacterium]|nr:hypothetical protein [Rhodospirillaceae bacterium]
MASGLVECIICGVLSIVQTPRVKKTACPECINLLRKHFEDEETGEIIVLKKGQLAKFGGDKKYKNINTYSSHSSVG